MTGYNGGGGGYPPPPPGHYLPPYPPSAPGFDSARRPPPPSGFPPGPPPPSGGFPPFPPGGGGFNQAPAPLPPRPPFPPVEQYNPVTSSSLPPKPTFTSYDPYVPAAYDPSAPQIHGNSSGGGYVPPRPQAQPQRPPARSGTASNEIADLPLLTSPTTATIGSYTANVYSLPDSQLPITKYVSVNPDEGVDIHRAVCQSGITKSLWYAEASVRAGEGWGSAIEWVLETSMSGAKLRVCAGNNDSLGTELSAIIKAVEGFYDQLKQSIRTAKPMLHELVLFCSSPAAIVSIDTSSRPESLQFCRLWASVCTEFARAHLTLVYLPSGNNDVEGLVLARKIADVASANSYAKRKKDRVIEDIYYRPGGGDPAPRGSTEGGPWQRGDADPSRRKSPFERPQPLPSPVPEYSPSPVASQPPQSPIEAPLPLLRSPFPPNSTLLPPVPDVSEDEPLQPRAGALCVTHFPDKASAKELGILFAQFGDINSVDIFSIPPVKPRFAFVTYTEPTVSIAGVVAALNHKPVKVDPQFAETHAEHLAIWNGHVSLLTVVESDANRLLPLALAKEFTNLPAYATEYKGTDPYGKRERDTSADIRPLPKRLKSGLSDTPEDKSDANPVAITSSDSHPARPASSTLSDSMAIAAPSSPPDANGSQNSHPHGLPPTPLTASHPGEPSSAMSSPSGKPPLTNSAAEPQEFPIKLSGKTLQAQINLVRNVFVKHDKSNWIAHTCLIATDLDQARRALQADLYATDEAFINGRDLEGTLSSRGFTAPRVDAFITKVLKVLDGIALADELEQGGPPAALVEDSSSLEAELAAALDEYPEQTREAMTAAGKVLEYLDRGKNAQEKKRLDVERRVGVLQGMVKIGEQVSSVVRYLLTDGQ